MSRTGLTLRIAATVFILMVGALPWLAPEPGVWPAMLDRDAAREGRLQVVPVAEDVPMPAGLQAGDRIDATRMTALDRLGFLSLTVAPGGTLTLSVVRETPGGATRVEPVVLRSVPYGDAPLSYMWREWPFLLLSLLLLWKGRDRVAIGIGVYLLAIGSLAPLLWAPLPSPWNALQRPFGEYVLRPLLPFGALVAMLGLLADRAPRLSRAMKLAYGVLFAVFFIDRLARDLPWAIGGTAIWEAPIRVSLPLTFAFIAAFFVFVVLIVRRMDPSAMLRARWVLLGIVLYVVSVLDVIVFSSEYLWMLPYFLSVLALGYATLRHKLVPTTFAISRTMVYGIIAALIVGAFAVVEDAVAAMAMGKNAGLALRLGVPLVLGILVHRLHGRVEHVIERVFFRQQFEAEARLERLVRESAYVARPGPLVARTLQDVLAALRATRIALYWREADGGYRRQGQAGEGAWPKRIDLDDPAFVALRSGQAWVELSSPRSPLAVGGLAFPMSVAGRLQGAIVCGERTSQYAPDERRLMGRVAHAVGTALHALSAQASEDAMEGLLAGRMSLDDMRRKLGRAQAGPSRAAG